MAITMPTPIITILSDFGLKDPYVAEMKATILSICPELKIIDISHSIDKYDIRMGAFTLASAAPHFPRETIHLAVVDPGVGTKRRPIIIETERFFYVGPDNGLLVLSAQKEGIRHTYQITIPQHRLPRMSRTFHGRDIFAPAAAYLAMGYPPSQLGREIFEYASPRFNEPYFKGSELIGEILHVDDFGNIITNIPKHYLKTINVSEGYFHTIKLGGRTLNVKFCSSYGTVPESTPLMILGSHDFLEISLNQGNAAQAFNAKVGNPIHLFRFLTQP